MNTSEVQLGFSGVEASLEKDGVFASLTSGCSMLPLFKTHRDIVIVEKIKESPKKYDAVLYKLGESYVLHRVIGYKKETDEYIIRGDNTFVKEYVKTDKIIATLSAYRRRGKYKTVAASSYKLYCRVWNFIYPLRYIWHKLRHLFFRLRGGIYGIFRKMIKK